MSQGVFKSQKGMFYQFNPPIDCVGVQVLILLCTERKQKAFG